MAGGRGGRVGHVETAGCGRALLTMRGGRVGGRNGVFGERSGGKGSWRDGVVGVEDGGVGGCGRVGRRRLGREGGSHRVDEVEAVRRRRGRNGRRKARGGDGWRRGRGRRFLLG